MRRVLSRFWTDPDMRKDAWGVVALFAILEAMLWIGHGAGLAIGGDQLLEVVK